MTVKSPGTRSKNGIHRPSLSKLSCRDGYGEKVREERREGLENKGMKTVEDA